jgi:hypothetical protein
MLKPTENSFCFDSNFSSIRFYETGYLDRRFKSRDLEERYHSCRSEAEPLSLMHFQHNEFENVIKFFYDLSNYQIVFLSATKELQIHISDFFRVCPSQNNLFNNFHHATSRISHIAEVSYCIFINISMFDNKDRNREISPLLYAKSSWNPFF